MRETLHEPGLSDERWSAGRAPRALLDRVVPMRRRGIAWAAARNRADALVLLSAPGCPICRYEDAAERRFFTWFVIEQYGELAMITRLRASLGMCPAHTRRLLAEASDSILTGVYRHIVAAALKRLGGDGPGRAPDYADGRCPACADVAWAARYAMFTLTATLGEPQVLARYAASGGICIPHLVELLPGCAPTRWESLTGVSADRLGREDREDGDLGLLAGRDPDAAARGRLRQHPNTPDGPSPPRHPRATADRARRAVSRDGCPACFAAAGMETRYLTWLGTEHAKGDSHFGLEVSGLCPAHLHDLATLDPATAAWLAEVQRSRWRNEARKALDRMESVPPPTLRGRLRSTMAALSELARRRPLHAVARWRETGRLIGRHLLRSRRHALELAVGPLLNLPPCGACRAAETAADREIALVLAALADSSFARRYEHCHGVCVRHVLALPSGPRSDLPRQVTRARLELLAWELEEAHRKSSWSVRYERGGAESTAWLRAPARIDGRVFLGGPANDPRWSRPA